MWLVSACAVDARNVGVVDDGPNDSVSSPSEQGVVNEPGSNGSDEGREDDMESMDQGSEVAEGSGNDLPLDTAPPGGADNPSSAPPSGAAPSGGAPPAGNAPPSSMPPTSTPAPQPEPAPPPPDQDITITLTGTGRITSSPAGIDCPGTCTARFAGGSTVTLSAEGVPTSGSYFAGWSGDCTGFDECSLAIDRAHAVSAGFGPANIVFITAGLVDPTQLGGLAGADRFCQARATAAGLPGTYVAWLSNSSADAIDRVQGARGARGWVRPDGLEVGNTITGMLAGVMFHPIRVDEAGGAIGNVIDIGDDNALTGTNDAGRWSGDSCGNWDDATAEVTLGSTSSVGSFFTNVVTAACSGDRARPSGLHCFGTDRAVRVEPRRQNGRLAFVSDELFTPGGGIAAADALCAAEAQALGRSGTFRSSLALGNTLPEQRFNLNGPPWVRVDGVLLADTAAGFFLDDYRRGPLNVTASGNYLNTALWFGRSRAGTADDDTNCVSWTSTTGTGLMQQATTTEPLQATIPLSCANSTPIICLEN